VSQGDSNTKVKKIDDRVAVKVGKRN